MQLFSPGSVVNSFWMAIPVSFKVFHAFWTSAVLILAIWIPKSPPVFQGGRLWCAGGVLPDLKTAAPPM
jgi:hypothetical protein